MEQIQVKREIPRISFYFLGLLSVGRPTGYYPPDLPAGPDWPDVSGSPAGTNETSQPVEPGRPPVRPQDEKTEENLL